MRVLHEPHLQREIGDQSPEDVDVHEEKGEEEWIHEERGDEPDEKQEDDEERAFFVVRGGGQELAEMGVGDLADHQEAERHRVGGQIAEVFAEGVAAFFRGGEEDDGAECGCCSGGGEPGEDVAALLLVHGVDVVGGEAERGASEVDAAEHADGDEFAGALDVAHVVGHDGDERGGGDAERGHVGEGVHLDAVQAGRVQETRGEAVEHVEDHGEEWPNNNCVCKMQVIIQQRCWWIIFRRKQILH